MKDRELSSTQKCIARPVLQLLVAACLWVFCLQFCLGMLSRVEVTQPAM